MADTSGGDQSPEVPELVELLKRLGEHRRKAYKQAYGALELRTKLDEIAESLLKSLLDDDHGAAGKALCRFVDTAEVECCDDARKRMLANLDAFMGSRRASLASGDTDYKSTFAVLGPEAEAAFDLWNGISKSPLSPEETDAYWNHPVLLACRWLEEHSGIKRDDWEIAAFRLTTPLGLRSMEPLPAPDGATIQCDGASDMLWMVEKFLELDRDETTAKLWEMLLGNCAMVLEEAGLLPATHATSPSYNGGTATQANQPPKAPARRPPKIAFQAWYVRDVLGVATQQQIADEMVRQGTPASQGQVSKWLAAVEEYRKAGGLLPTLDELNKLDTDTVDPAIIDMGARLDGRTPRQRPRPDDDADSWPE